jgi:hypothetical protein
MKTHLKPWQLALILIALCAAVLGVLEWRRSYKVYDAATMLQCLPRERSVHMYLDVDALRSGGLLDLLAGSRAAEDADYQSFVNATGFDYRVDLDAAAVAFTDGNVYMAIRGHFEWARLSDYAMAQGGRCRNGICVMPGSQKNRFISYYLLEPDVLALAVSADDTGANMIGVKKWPAPPQIPSAALWISTPAFVYANANSLPQGTHAFLSPLAQTSGVTYTLGLAKPGAVAMPGIDQNYQLQMEARSPTPKDAAQVVHQMEAATDLLRKMLSRDKLNPGPEDLAAVLTGGHFEAQDDRVTGTWPIDGRFVKSLLAGKVD